LETEGVHRDHYGKRLMRKTVDNGFIDCGPSIGESRAAGSDTPTSAAISPA
jgi:hypothetical protein